MANKSLLQDALKDCQAMIFCSIEIKGLNRGRLVTEIIVKDSVLLKSTDTATGSDFFNQGDYFR